MPYLPNVTWQLGGSTSYATYMHADELLCEDCNKGLLQVPGVHLYDAEDSGVQCGVLYGSIRFRELGPIVDLCNPRPCPLCGAWLEDAGWRVRFIINLRPAITI